MRKSSRKVSAFIVGVVSVAALLGPVGSAQAAPEDCPEGDLCIWEHANYEGAMLGIHQGNSEADLSAAGTWFNDQASSWRNNTNQMVCGYTDWAYGGRSFYMPPRAQNNMYPEDNDVLSSVLWC